MAKLLKNTRFIIYSPAMHHVGSALLQSRGLLHHDGEDANSKRQGNGVEPPRKSVPQ